MMQQEGKIPDSNHKNIIHRFTSPTLMPYIQLMRIDRPIGIWLLMLPAFWGLAFSDNHSLKTWCLYPIFALGALIIRSAGCIYNDILDRDLDAQVTRTKTRPLVAKTVSLTHALILLISLLLIGFLILITLNRQTIILGVFALMLIGIYPLMKRITYWPQAFLGFTMNWGVLMGYAAIHEKVSLSLLVLYASSWFWTLGYDTIYAHQDKEDDLIAGIKSTALRLGGNSKAWVWGFYVLAAIFLSLAGYLENLPKIFYLTPVIVSCFFIFQLNQWNPSKPSSSLSTFKSNKWVGVIVFCGILFSRIFT